MSQKGKKTSLRDKVKVIAVRFIGCIAGRGPRSDEALLLISIRTGQCNYN